MKALHTHYQGPRGLSTLLSDAIAGLPRLLSAQPQLGRDTDGPGERRTGKAT